MSARWVPNTADQYWVRDAEGARRAIPRGGVVEALDALSRSALDEPSKHAARVWRTGLDAWVSPLSTLLRGRWVKDTPESEGRWECERDFSARLSADGSWGHAGSWSEGERRWTAGVVAGDADRERWEALWGTEEQEVVERLLGRRAPDVMAPVDIGSETNLPFGAEEQSEVFREKQEFWVLTNDPDRRYPVFHIVSDNDHKNWTKFSANGHKNQYDGDPICKLGIIEGRVYVRSSKDGAVIIIKKDGTVLTVKKEVYRQESIEPQPNWVCLNAGDRVCSSETSGHYGYWELRIIMGHPSKDDLSRIGPSAGRP